MTAAEGSLHHVELWVPDLRRAELEWGWLLSELGYLPLQSWAAPGAVGSAQTPTSSSNNHPPAPREITTDAVLE